MGGFYNANFGLWVGSQPARRRTGTGRLNTDRLIAPVRTAERRWRSNWGRYLAFFILFALLGRFPAIAEAPGGRNRPKAGSPERFVSHPEEAVNEAEPVEAVFGKDCEKMLVREINRADTEILVAIYSITRKSITSALVRATRRGVRVIVKYDAKSYEWQGMTQAVGYMAKRGIECVRVKMAGKYSKMHHKFAVIDRKRVLTGSYNYTTVASTVSYENLVLLNSVEVARTFTAEFQRIRSR